MHVDRNSSKDEDAQTRWNIDTDIERHSAYWYEAIFINIDYKQEDTLDTIPPMYTQRELDI